MKKLNFVIFTLFAFLSVYNAYAEDDVIGGGKITGNFQIDLQSYKADSLIGAQKVNEAVLSNGFLMLNYSSSNFNAGLRYENYLNPILGIDKRYQGSGVSYRFGEFVSEMIDITAGNFYEQFGSGMIFRSYQEYALGLDNAMDGLKVKFRPTEGVEIKGLIGKQRKFWGLGDGIVRGGDLNLDVNQSFKELIPEGMQLSIGGSFISKYQKDLSTQYNLPQNVLLWAGRASLTGSSYSLDVEYGYKNMDPSSTNSYNYNPGSSLLINSSYFGEGFGASLSFHRNDNMDVRSDRNEVGNVLLLNFLPPLTKQHTYALAAMYPYATQLNGEIGLQSEITLSIPKQSSLGGEYGATLNLNYSEVHSIDKNPITIDTANNSIIKNNTPFFKFGDQLYFREFHIEFTKKFSSEFKSIFTYLNQTNNRDVIEVSGAAHYGKVYNNIFIGDFTYKFSSKYALRTELQYMLSKQDSAANPDDKQYGDWASGLLELTASPNWYFTLADQWNLGNSNDDLKIHYITTAITYIYEATRVSFGFGRQRQGIICVGGVCRPVPASNGFFLNISSSF